MRDSMPIGEIDIDEFNENLKKYQKELLENREEIYKDKIDRLNRTNLNAFANNLQDGVYAPYLLEFGLLLNILNNNNRVQVHDIESLKIKVDVLEQILKMKTLPPFSIECHIESNDIDKCTSIKSLIEKKIFKNRKYRLVFHRKEATFEEKYFKSKLKIKVALLVIFGVILSILSVFLFTSSLLFAVSLFIIFFTIFLM